MKKLFVTLLFAGFISFIPSSLHLSITSSLSAQIPADGLVAWYPFNGNANDESGNGNTMTNFGGVLTNNRNNIAQQAYSFVNGYTSNTSSSYNSPAFTFSAWVKPNIITNGLGDIGGTYFNYQGYFVGVSGGAPHVRIHSINPNGDIDAISSEVIQPNVWSLVTATFQGNILKIYVNGVNTGTVNTNGFQFQNREVLAIGRSPWVLNEAGASFPGSVDDVALYNRALSPSEIQQLYQDQTGQIQVPPSCSISATSSSFCSGEIAEFTFSDPSLEIPISNPMPYIRMNVPGVYVGPNGSDLNGNGTLLNPYKTVQYAISMATNGQSVNLLSGVYTGTGNTNLSLQGKSIVLQSVNGPGVTIIDGQNTTNGFLLNQGETVSTIIRGVTIQNCIPTVKEASAIFVEDNSGVAIRNCVFKGNNSNNVSSASVLQFGDNEVSGPNSSIDSCIFFQNNSRCIYSSKKSWYARNCLFEQNSFSGIFIGNGHDSGDDQDISNCVFRNNTLTGGTFVILGHAKKLENSFFIDNVSTSRGLVYMGTVWSGTNLVNHCTFYNNSAVSFNSNTFDHLGQVKNSVFYGSTGLQIISGKQVSIPFTNCNGSVPSGAGNNSGDPLFVNPALNQFGYAAGSPCLGSADDGGNMGANGNSIPTWLWSYSGTAVSNNSPVYNWSNQAYGPSAQIELTSSETITCTVTQGDYSCTASVDATVNPNITNAISATIIEGETYNLGAQTLSTPGTYTEVFTSAAGCDSTVTLTLAVEPLLTCIITAPTTTLCEGESVTLSVNSTGGTGASSQLPANLQQGLVAYYPLNGNANDESGNGNNGVVNGATLTSDRFGNVGSAYSFDGVDDLIQIADSQNQHIYSANQNSTISFWISRNSNNSMDIISKGWHRDQFDCPNYVGNSYLSVRYYNENQSEGYNYMLYNSSISQQARSNSDSFSDWNHIVIVRDDVAKIYVNGELSFIQTSNDGWIVDYNNSVNSPLTFGARNNFNNSCSPYWNYFFTGKLDDISFYNRKLSYQEIQQLFTSQSYAWSTNATTPTITVTPTTSTTYSCTVTQGNQTCTASVDITVNPNVTNDISATIIEGETYILGTQTLTTAGTYTEVFTSAAGCDSTVTLTLSVNPASLNCNITAPTTTLCEGESVMLSVNTTGGTGASSQLPANLQQGLVAYYPFNGNANDESGNGNNGLVNGAMLISDRHGNEFGSYGFNGISDFITTDYMGIEGSGARTFSVWFRTNQLYTLVPSGGYSNEQMCLLSYGSPSSGSMFDCSLNHNCEGISLDVHAGLYTRSCITSDDFWHNVVFVFNGNTNNKGVVFYLDGLLVDEFSYCSGQQGSQVIQTGNTWPLVIGAYSNEQIRFFKGQLDDIMLYNRALSPSEIQQLYTAQSYAWSTNETTPTITVTPTQNTTYSCTITQGNQTCSASVEITVNPNITNAISATIIDGETYTLGTQTLTTTGTYTEVFTSAAGCDSTVTLTLAVEPLLTCEITAPITSLCEGESVTLSVNTTGGASPSSQLPANLQQGLVAYYPFNGNVQDQSAFNNDLTGVGHLFANGRDGVLNNSVYLSNDAYLFAANQAQISEFDQGQTINFWFKILDFPSDGKEHFIISKGNGNGFYECFFSDYNDLNAFIYRFGVASNSYHPQGTGVDFSNIALNEWTNFTLTTDLSTHRLYINGEFYMEEFLPSGIGISTSGLYIGRNVLSNSSTGYFNGFIDDLLIYNRALSPSEIQQLYTAQSYAWSTNETTPTITVAPTQTTTYTATVTTATQTCTDSITITVNPLLTWYADADADGFGNLDAVVQDCNQPQGYIADNTDCNDADALAYPNAEEICFDQMDNNCNGSIDENCAIPGCTIPNACNFDPQANTNDGSCILPQPETCNGLDDNCNGQVDEGLSVAAINAVSATTALYPVCSGNSIRSANLNNGANSAVIEGNGNDLWYSFTALYNTFRAGLSAASGDNDVRLYTMTLGGCLELIETEHENTNGNQTLLSDQLTVGQTYYVAVHNISGPMNASAKICFNHLNASTCDHYYSNNTGIYNSVCNSFKAQYRANAVAYTFDILSATQNNVNQNITPWSYTTTSASTVVARLGTLLPANQGTSAIVYTLKVPVLYSLFDAAGNFENLFAQATTTCTVTLNAEQTVSLRISDRCPTSKSISSSIAPDRTVCGAMRYDWEFTEVLPNPGTAQVVQGGNFTTVLFLSNVPGITSGKTYNVRVRPVHSSGIVGQWGAVQCLRVGAPGMVMQSESESESDWSKESRVSSISIYPNPTATGSFVLQYNGPRRGELIFAQESMTELVMMDITGKIVFETNVVLNGNVAEIHFGELESGLYLVDFGGERSRLQVVK